MGAHCTTLAICLKFLVFKNKKLEKKKLGGKKIFPLKYLKNQKATKLFFVFWFFLKVKKIPIIARIKPLGKGHLYSPTLSPPPHLPTPGLRGWVGEFLNTEGFIEGTLDVV